MKIPFALYSYKSRARQVAQQRVVNGYLEAVPEGAKTQIPILGTPGIKDWTTVGSGLPRGGAKWQNKFYVVVGEVLYRVESGGVSHSLGAIPGTERCHMAAGENGLAIATHDNLYVFDGKLERVTDPDFRGCSQVGWLAGYYIYLRPNTGVFFTSNVANAKAIDPLDFATAEAQPDKTIALLTDSLNVMFFGEDSTEIWGLRGGAFPFVRFPNGVFDIGCAAADSPAKLDNIAFWLADDKTVRQFDNGMTKISTEGMDYEVGKYERVDDAIGMTTTVAGRATYILTFPTAKKTWQYSLNTGLWNELESFDIGYWRAHSTIQVYGKTIVLDSESNKLGELDPDTYTDFGTQSVMRMRSAPVADGNRWLFHERLFLEFQSGTDMDVMLRWTDDGFNWGDEYRRSLGDTGKYSERVMFHSLGRAKNRVYECAISGNGPRHFLGAEGAISRGGH